MVTGLTPGFKSVLKGVMVQINEEGERGKQKTKVKQSLEKNYKKAARVLIAMRGRLTRNP